jgi:hypothetical protein
VEYDDGLIACSGEGLVIRRYSAFLRPKQVPYAQIRAVKQVGLGGVSFGSRLSPCSASTAWTSLGAKAARRLGGAEKVRTVSALGATRGRFFVASGRVRRVARAQPGKLGGGHSRRRV